MSKIIKHVHFQRPAAEIAILSTEISVTEEKCHHFWSQFNQFVHKFQYAIDKRVEKIVNQAIFYLLFLWSLLSNATVITYIALIFCFYFVTIKLIPPSLRKLKVITSICYILFTLFVPLIVPTVTTLFTCLCLFFGFAYAFMVSLITLSFVTIAFAS